MILPFCPQGTGIHLPLPLRKYKYNNTKSWDLSKLHQCSRCTIQYLNLSSRYRFCSVSTLPPPTPSPTNWHCFLLVCIVRKISASFFLPLLSTLLLSHSVHAQERNDYWDFGQTQENCLDHFHYWASSQCVDIRCVDIRCVCTHEQWSLLLWAMVSQLMALLEFIHLVLHSFFQMNWSTFINIFTSFTTGPVQDWQNARISVCACTLGPLCLAIFSNTDLPGLHFEHLKHKTNKQQMDMFAHIYLFPVCKMNLIVNIGKVTLSR